LELKASTVLHPEQGRALGVLLGTFPVSRAEGTGKLIFGNSGFLGFFNVSQRELKQKVSIFLVNVAFFAISLIAHNKVFIVFFALIV
jgi:hypothetical protein